MTDPKLTPREPTPEMVDAGFGYCVLPSDVWRAMHDAAPKVEAEPVPNYSEMSREQLERHTVRLAQASQNALDFWHKHALGPLMAPSCLCCGKLPEEVAIQHLELPGIVICKACRDAAHPAAPQPAALPELSDAEIAEAIDNIDFSRMVTASDMFYLIARAVIAALRGKR